VDQAEKIKKFVPEPYWSMEALIQEKGKALNMKWCKGKIYDRTIVTILHSRVNVYNLGEVVSVERS
jgi:DNA topoisomerase-3